MASIRQLVDLVEITELLHNLLSYDRDQSLVDWVPLLGRYEGRS